MISAQEDVTRKEYLKQLLKVLPKDRYIDPDDQIYQSPGTPLPHVTPEDFAWRDWVKRTGELPPDFDEMPTLPFLPNLLILDEGRKNIPVKTIAQWNKKREQMKEQAQHWITGTVPPPPDNLRIEVLEEKLGEVTERTVLLKFGPGHQAQLHVTLLIPPGEGPFPVFLCPWKKDRYDWVQAAVRRGYIGCRFTATDPKYGYPDDSQKYEELWWPEYDFSALMRWGWAASRAIDYLYTLNYVNKDQIALTGLSRNGKSSLWAAAYDERIKAVIPISGGTGGEIPFRYTTDKYNIETMERKIWTDPHWLHPRIRFFVGRENKLPVDQNSLMALIAPRGLMITSSVIESAGNPWGIEQAYLSARKVYEFLGAEDKIALNLRYGLHPPSARDMERYLDFFDYVFGRGNIRPENKLYYDYSFSKWLDISGEMIDPLDYPQKGIDDLLIDKQGEFVKNLSDWQKKVREIKEQINWGLGEEPPSLGPGEQPDYLRSAVGFPELGPDIESKPFLFGRLYYPSGESDSPQAVKMPVVIYLHEYSYSTGFAKAGSEVYTKTGDMVKRFTDAGYAVYLFNQIGFGSRIEEGRYFYERFPHWSKMGRMVADVRWAVDALSELGFIDSQKIYTAGYSLGATVGLYSAALDERIAGVISVCGFTPMRFNTPGKTAEGIYEYSHLHGLLPRLGFFVGEEDRIQYDFNEILAAIAPRPLLIVSPTWDQYASFSDVQNCMNEVKKVYDLYNQKDKMKLFAPEDYNRFSDDMKEKVIFWMKRNFN
jgi:pimeloyl-ACP methyl ester carboxylesterase